MRNTPKKGQSGIELMMFISFSLLVFSVFYLIVLQHNITNMQEKSNIYSENILDKVTYEIEIAKSIGNGYQKNFTIPDKILGSDYEIKTGNNILILDSTQSHIRTISTQNIVGNITPGENRIINIEGILYANP